MKPLNRREENERTAKDAVPEKNAPETPSPEEEEAPLPAVTEKESSRSDPGAAPGQGLPPEALSWRKLDLVREIPLEVTVLLGKARVTLGELFTLNRGSIIALEQAAGSPVEIRINNRPVARGEVVLVDDQFGVRITEQLPDPGPEDPLFPRGRGPE